MELMQVTHKLFVKRDSDIKLLVGDGGNKPQTIINNKRVIKMFSTWKSQSNSFLIQLTNLLKAWYYPIYCNMKLLHMILCENATEPRIQLIPNLLNLKDISLKRQEKVFKCTDGSYISKSFVCDGTNDCPMVPNDELNCNVTRVTVHF